jgi:Regulator of chromosome condensation (RCC1) repeat
MNAQATKAIKQLQVFTISNAFRCAIGLGLAVIGLGSANAQSPFLLNPIDLQSGNAHTCALTSAGGVKCWGLNYAGLKAGDFNADGNSDLIVERAEGAATVLLMNGAAVASAAFLATAGSRWTVAQTGEFNGDGKKNILLRGSNSEFAVLLMNGLVVAATNYLARHANTTAAQIGDYNIDGADDILRRNADGTFRVLFMDATSSNGGAISVWPTQTFGTLLPLRY